MAWAPLTRAQLAGVFVAALVTLLLADVVRLRVPRANALFFSTFRWFASPREEERIASSTWYVAGALLVFVLFGTRIAIPSVLVLAFADPAASYIGRRWGRRPFGTGSLLGTSAFALVAFSVLWFFVAPGVAVIVGCVVALIECQPLGVDDNLTVPMGTALCLAVAAAVLG